MDAYENTIITGLLFERICDDQDCPMKPAYLLPPAERVAWAMNLSDLERKKILIHYHEWIKRLDNNLLRAETTGSWQLTDMNS